MMIIAIITIFAGMPFGLLFKNKKFIQALVGQFLNFSVWILLFLLGMGLGMDDSLVSQLDSLGLQALFISSFGMLGTLAGAWLLGRYTFSDSFGQVVNPPHTPNIPNAPNVPNHISEQNTEKSTGKNAEEKAKNNGMSAEKQSKLKTKSNKLGAEKQSKLNALKDSLIVLSFFTGGILSGIFPIFPMEWDIEAAAAWALYTLLFLAGMSVGFDLKAFRILRELKGKILLIPFITILGTLLASPLACFIFPDLRVIEAMAVGAGLGYYSLSSTIISQEISPALGSVALLSNMIREIFTLVFCPVMVRYVGGLGPVMVGGATSNDSSLPIIAKYCGERYAIIAIFSGVFLTLLVPILVSFILYFA